MSASGLLIHSSALRGISELSVVFGSSPKGIFERFDLCFSNIEKNDFYLPIETYKKVIDYCSNLFEQPNFSETLARFQLANSTFDICIERFGDLTIRERLSALAKQCRYLIKGVDYVSNVSDNVAAIDVVTTSDKHRLPVVAQVHTLTIIDGLLNRIHTRFNPARSWVISEDYNVSHAPATIVEPGRTALQFAPELLKKKSKTSNSTKFSLNNDALLSVVTEIKKQLPRGSISLEDVAEQFNISGRQLQRHLKAKGTNFRRMLDAVRFEYARKYLSDSSFSLNTIAERLGYSEDSAFSRSFKRWSGLAPKNWKSARKSED